RGIAGVAARRRSPACHRQHSAIHGTLLVAIRSRTAKRPAVAGQHLALLCYSGVLDAQPGRSLRGWVTEAGGRRLCPQCAGLHPGTTLRRLRFIAADERALRADPAEFALCRILPCTRQDTPG